MQGKVLRSDSLLLLAPLERKVAFLTGLAGDFPIPSERGTALSYRVAGGFWYWEEAWPR